MPKIIHNGITYAGLPDIDYDCEITTVTLYAANWSDGVYTISDSRIDGTSIQEYMPGLGITDTQLESLQGANIHDFGQDSGHAYLKAYGDTPEIDIPIRVMFNPGVKTKEVENSNAWNFLDSKVGSQSISLPTDCNEILIICKKGETAVSSVIPTDWLSSTTIDFCVGGNYFSTQYGGMSCVFKINQSSVNLYYWISNSGYGTDSATTYVYYR